MESLLPVDDRASLMARWLGARPPASDTDGGGASGLGSVRLIGPLRARTAGAAGRRRIVPPQTTEIGWDWGGCRCVEQERKGLRPL